MRIRTQITPSWYHEYIVIGRAKCCPNDTYDKSTGRKIAKWERSVMKIDGYNGFDGVFIDKEKGSRECRVKYDSIIGMIIVWPLLILSFIVCIIYKLIRKLCGI